jgi:hypothetical protein
MWIQCHVFTCRCVWRCCACLKTVLLSRRNSTSNSTTCNRHWRLEEKHVRGEHIKSWKNRNERRERRVNEKREGDSYIELRGVLRSAQLSLIYYYEFRWQITFAVSAIFAFLINKEFLKKKMPDQIDPSDFIVLFQICRQMQFHRNEFDRSESVIFRPRILNHMHECGSLLWLIKP